MASKQAKESKITVDLTVYPLAAVQAAAYSLTDRLYVRISRGAKGTAAVALKPKSGGDAELLSDAFHNELLHESLRLQVSLANQKIREYIVTKALVSAQVPSLTPAAAGDAPAAPEACSERTAQSAPDAVEPMDAELEKEIEKLLAEIENGSGDDPLGVSIPWEEKHGDKNPKAASTPRSKAAKSEPA